MSPFLIFLAAWAGLLLCEFAERARAYLADAT